MSSVTAMCVHVFTGIATGAAGLLTPVQVGLFGMASVGSPALNVPNAKGSPSIPSPCETTYEEDLTSCRTQASTVSCVSPLRLALSDTCTVAGVGANGRAKRYETPRGLGSPKSTLIGVPWLPHPLSSRSIPAAFSKRK